MQPEFARTAAQPFFPTFAWVFDLKPEQHQPLNRQVLADLERLTAHKPPMPPGRNWQTEQNLHELAPFAELVSYFRAAMAQVLEVLEVDHDGFEITGCWANMSPRGAAHPPHTHPNNYLSGVYYVAAPPGGDSISFHDPRPQVEILAPPVRKQNVYNTTIHNIRVEPGRIVIFPAWFVHSVLTNASDALRVSIAFNIMFPDFHRRMSRPKWQGIPLKEG
jgi:uncharacterized protein (TIGR02466 family)